MRLRFALASCLIALPISAPAQSVGFPQGDPRAEGFAPETLDKIRPVLEAAVASRKIAGGATMIVRHGKVVHLAMVGMRDAEAGKPIERSTIYRIASMTKPITAAAVMILVDDGKLKPEDPVSRFLPEFSNPMVAQGSPGKITLRPATRPITIHHLLTHTSGLTYRFMGNPMVGPSYVEAAVSDGLAETPGTIADNVKRLARLPLLFDPGTNYEYSLGDDVLGRVVEVVSGRTFDQFLRERMFGPLKMVDTGFVVPKADRDRLSACYIPDERGAVRRMPDTPVQSGALVYSANFATWDTGTYYSGGAGLVSTLDDYARFCQMLLNRGDLDGARVLKPETVESMLRDQVAPINPPVWGVGDGYSYGFGVVRPGNKYADPAGEGAVSWTGFFGTYFWIDRKHGAFALYMAQAPTVPNLNVGPDFKRITYEALIDK